MMPMRLPMLVPVAVVMRTLVRVTTTRREAVVASQAMKGITRAVMVAMMMMMMVMMMMTLKAWHRH